MTISQVTEKCYSRVNDLTVKYLFKLISHVVRKQE